MENLAWGGDTQVRHLLSFLTHDIGVQSIQKQIQRKLPPKNVVVQYGCHALRPYSITGFDNPFAPNIFERLLTITGLRVVEWSKSTECCGHPILNRHPDLSLKILQNKFHTARKAGADYICTACTHCQMQYETMEPSPAIDDINLTPLLFTQLLGAALGLSEEVLSQAGRLPSNLFLD